MMLCHHMTDDGKPERERMRYPVLPASLRVLRMVVDYPQLMNPVIPLSRYFQ